MTTKKAFNALLCCGIVFVLNIPINGYSQKVGVEDITGRQYQITVIEIDDKIIAEEVTLVMSDVKKVRYPGVSNEYKPQFEKLAAGGVMVLYNYKEGEYDVYTKYLAAAPGSFFNFYHDAGSVLWKVVYDKPMDKSSFDAMVEKNKSLKLIKTESESATLDLDVFVYERSGYTMSGRVKVEWKEDRYRVTVRDIRYKPGSSTNATATVLLGGNPDFEFYADKDFVKKNGDWQKSNNNIVAMDKALQKLFVMEIKKDDW